eukprot:CAMPEP_0177686092 /NCGR_PEP_ID=MMETSP0447-20121125/33376_1 /TAXON_ID=0 /ORGANISM="Stygamoeba regulata, Strain BSH-02190019" /LENGTH=144 /DNA_ID=CAMNT_0019196175 /DNA_START=180 /DNA_END=610 /DNA_ORIENTATION=-
MFNAQRGLNVCGLSAFSSSPSCFQIPSSPHTAPGASPPEEPSEAGAQLQRDLSLIESSPSAVTTPPDLVTPPLAVNRDPVSKAHASSSQNNSDWEKAHPPSENPSRAIKKPGFTRVVELKRNPDPDQSGKLLYFLRRQRNVTKG